MRKQIITPFIIVTLALFTGGKTTAQHANELRQIIYTLASDSMEGRQAGKVGGQMAARYIAGYFIQNNIPSPKGTFDTLDYLQAFSLNTFYDKSRVYAIMDADTFYLRNAETIYHGKLPYSFEISYAITHQIRTMDNLMQALDTLSPTGKPVVFVLPYREYIKMGKRFINREFLLSGDGSWTPSAKKRKNYWMPLVRLLTASENRFNRAVVLMSDNEIIDKNMKVKGNKELIMNPKIRFFITQTFYSLNVKTENLVAVLPSSNPDAGWLVLGAHYDHMGKDKRGQIYYGADDNASGTAAVMVAAKNLAASPERLPFNVMFVAFGAEELGLWGSRYFVLSDLMPEKMVAMINLDMVGRPENPEYQRNYVYARYTIKGKKMFKKPVQNTGVDSLIVVTKPPFWEKILFRFGSDHASFASKGVPFLVLFTGLHPDYHKPADRPEKIDYENLNRIVAWLILLTKSL